MAEPHDEPGSDLELSILRVAVREAADGAYDLVMQTSRGDLGGLLHACEGGTGAVIFVGGASGGTDGPADRLYVRLGQELVERGITSLRLGYRLPGEFEECLLDTLGGLSFLRGIGAERVALVGHSFGGAVVIKAGELSGDVSGVAALSSQLYGTTTVANLAPKPLLLVHGMDDQVLEATASQIIYDRAGEPKELVLYPGAGHSLLQCRDELHDLLTEWIVRVAAP